MKQSEILLECDCGCSIVRISDLDDFISLSFLVSSFGAKQQSPLGILKDRLKLALYGLIGKEYLLHDVVLTREQLKQLAKDITDNYI